RDPLHRIVAPGTRIAAAMPSHVQAQHAKSRLQQRRHLLAPHPAVGHQRVGHTDDRAVLGSGQVVIDTASFKRQQHDDDSIWHKGGVRAATEALDGQSLAGRSFRHYANSAQMEPRRGEYWPDGYFTSGNFATEKAWDAPRSSPHLRAEGAFNPERTQRSPPLAAAAQPGRSPLKMNRDENVGRAPSRCIPFMAVCCLSETMYYKSIFLKKMSLRPVTFTKSVWTVSSLKMTTDTMEVAAVTPRPGRSELSGRE